MLQTPYQIIKERHIKELELEDDLMSKVPIRCVLCIHYINYIMIVLVIIYKCNNNKIIK